MFIEGSHIQEYTVQDFDTPYTEAWEIIYVWPVSPISIKILKFSATKHHLYLMLRYCTLQLKLPTLGDRKCTISIIILNYEVLHFLLTSTFLICMASLLNLETTTDCKINDLYNSVM